MKLFFISFIMLVCIEGYADRPEYSQKELEDNRVRACLSSMYTGFMSYESEFKTFLVKDIDQVGYNFNSDCAYNDFKYDLYKDKFKIYYYINQKLKGSVDNKKVLKIYN